MAELPPPSASFPSPSPLPVAASAKSPLILSIDQGTTGTTALVVGLDGSIVGRHTVEFPQHYPKPGWVEHDLGEIWGSVQLAVTRALEAASVDGTRIAAIGITNQRETTAIWDRRTRAPIHRAIVWQCRRTADQCDRLRREGHSDFVRRRTGLVLDAYFSGTKIAWILDHVEGARTRAERGDLAFGTIDSWLVDQLTAGDVHVTDVTNASRTLLMGLETGEWDDDALALFRVPKAVLPRIVGNAEIVGRTRGLSFLPDGIPIAGMAGDQQAALFGQACFRQGDAKCTYGTGAFALVNIGHRPTLSLHGLVTTVAWKLGNQNESGMTYALEGSAFIAGAAVQWLRDGLGIIRAASEVEPLARRVPSSESVVFVPALAGLGAPYWDPKARGTLTGITRGTTAAHIARATLEGIAFQVQDLLAAMVQDAGRALSRLRVDGGASRNDLLMQFQADISNVEVERPTEVESTGRGAAMLAGVGSGLASFVVPSASPAAAEGGKYESAEAESSKPNHSGIAEMLRIERTFSPTMPADERAEHRQRWANAIARSQLHS